MKNIKKAIALCLALLLCLTFPVGVSAAEVGDATIDFSKTGSLTLYVDMYLDMEMSMGEQSM